MAGKPLPYLASPGSVKTSLERIRTAATPERVTQDFVTTMLQIKGGTGTELYKRFRNRSIGGTAIADAIKIGYAPLSDSNEYFYELADTELNNLILQVTGLDHDNQVAKLTFATLKGLKSFADFKGTAAEETRSTKEVVAVATHQNSAAETTKLGLNLAYTINLNLPPTSDQAVFNAIFKAIKEHLIPNE
jgi:hypothetical protein